MMVMLLYLVGTTATVAGLQPQFDLHLAQPAVIKPPKGWDDFSCGPEACISDDEAAAEDARMEGVVNRIYDLKEAALETEDAATDDDMMILDQVLISPEEHAMELEVKLAGFAGTDNEVSSSTLVKLDENGVPLDLDGDDFVFVDEVRCGGCAMCSAIASATFFSEEAHGKGRAFQQGGDDRRIIDEAILACPKGAIKRLEFEELLSAEALRDSNSKHHPQRVCKNCADAGGESHTNGASPVHPDKNMKRVVSRRSRQTEHIRKYYAHEKKVAELL